MAPDPDAGRLPDELLPDYAPQTLTQGSMRKEAFLFRIGVLVNAGLVLSQVVAYAVPGHTLLPGQIWPIIVFVPMGLIAMLAGIELAIHTKDSRGSLLGLAVSSIGLGLILCPWPEAAEIEIQRIATGFGIGVLTLTLVALWKARWLGRFGAFPIGLIPIAPLLAYTDVLPLLLQFGPLHLVAITGALAYYDLYISRAMDLPRNANNAVDTACGLYMDAVDRFFRFFIRT